ncbi:MAG: acetylornithine/succinylornithine family transaminase [Oscillospiraceae bacterium]
MSSKEIIEEYNTYIMQSYGRVDVAIAEGKGDHCLDEDGVEYIDFGSGIGTNSLGYADTEWADAISEQAHKLQHTSNYYYAKIQADFAKTLCTKTGYSNMFFGNSGAEANECAIKIARKYSFDKYGKGRHNIITLVNSFHGRTLCTLSATGQDAFHNFFFPFVEGFRYVEANNIADLREKLDDTVCAVMFEPIQGEGGVLPIDKEFVDEIFKLAAEKDVVTICDEVQTGTGRTGKFLALENFGKKSDLTTLAKGLAGGIPIGVCLSGEKCKNVLTKGTHGSTFGGNPICCAGGEVVLKKVFAEGFLDEVAKKGDYFRKKLAEISEVTGTSGIGLMIGVSLKTKNADEIKEECRKLGLLVLTAKEKIRFLPPLTISYAEIDLGLEIFKKSLEK